MRRRTAESFNRPQVLSFLMAKHVAFPVVEQDAEKSEARRIPTVLDFGDFELLFMQKHAPRALVSFMSGVALHAQKRRRRRLWVRPPVREIIHRISTCSGQRRFPRSRRLPRK